MTGFVLIHEGQLRVGSGHTTEAPGFGLPRGFVAEVNSVRVPWELAIPT